MKLFAIADLHMPGPGGKPMEIFGPHWANHMKRISDDWRERVTEEDTVLIPGDISWAMQLKEAAADLSAIGALPGRKILLRGNHDYWWNSATKVRSCLPPGMEIIQNNAVELADCVICGTRGWIFPTEEHPLEERDQKIYLRELGRLELSLQAADRLRGEKRLVCMMHYPPLSDLVRSTGFTERLERYGVSAVLYGHLHGEGIRAGWNGIRNGILYQLVSCDSLSFQLYEVPLDRLSGESIGL